MREKIKCIECEEELTQKELNEWWDESNRCCDGYMCGCMGMPIDPPICDKCSEKLFKARVKDGEG